MTEVVYKTKKQILNKANTIINKSLREVISNEAIQIATNQIIKHEKKEKGYLGKLVEKYFFNINPGNSSKPDFLTADVELKVTPIKYDNKKTYVSKERLVFSKINYCSIINETWESSSFLQKNKSLLLMFYLWLNNYQNILDYKFKFVQLLELLGDISSEDIYQIQKDWEYIVSKIDKGEAHLLSEGDTFYLGACTKAKNKKEVVNQPNNSIKAKPRAFSLKQKYVNYLIQTRLLKNQINISSVINKQKKVDTIENIVQEKFVPFIGKTDEVIISELKLNLSNKLKAYKRLIVNGILGVKTNKIVELEKANITLKVVTLEETGKLRESISFPSFNYKNLINEVWESTKKSKRADFRYQLESKKFLFVVFQKQKDRNNIVLRKTFFWNFPMQDIDKAKDVWETTVELVKEGRIIKDQVQQKNGKIINKTYFPGLNFNGVTHVRPHAQNKKDEIDLPHKDLFTGKSRFTKHCFWLNAKYIENAINEVKYKI